MRALRPAAVSAGLMAVIVACAYASSAALAPAVLLAVAALAIGWGKLLALPHPRGSGTVVALSGTAAVVAAWFSADQAEPLKPFVVILALSVLGAFGHELLRRDGRPRLVESLSGTFAGQVLAVLGAGWMLVPEGGAGVHVVGVSACAVVAASLATAVPLPLRITGWLAILAGGTFGALAAVLLPDVTWLPGMIIGMFVGVVVVALDRLLTYQPACAQWVGTLAAAAAPVLAAGTTAYTVARVVLG